MNIEQKMARVLSQDEAATLARSRWWDAMPPEQAARLQLGQDRLCMDFGTFHAGLTTLLRRPVAVVEIGDIGRLRSELLAFEDGIRRAQKSAAYAQGFAAIANIMPSATHPQKV